jgi:hypothetical protein
MENQRDLDKAISDIKYIKEVIDASKDFFVSGWSGVAWGLAFIVGAVVSMILVKIPPGWGLAPTLWALWITLSACAAGVELFFFIKGTYEAKRTFLSPLTLKIILAEILMTGMGLVLTLLFIHTKMPEYIPGAWLLSLGINMTAAGLFIPGGIWVFGLVTFVASIISLILPQLGLYCLVFAGLVTLGWGVLYLIVRRR